MALPVQCRQWKIFLSSRAGLRHSSSNTDTSVKCSRTNYTEKTKQNKKPKKPVFQDFRTEAQEWNTYTNITSAQSVIDHTREQETSLISELSELYIHRANNVR